MHPPIFDFEAGSDGLPKGFHLPVRILLQVQSMCHTRRTLVSPACLDEEITEAIKMIQGSVWLLTGPDAYFVLVGVELQVVESQNPFNLRLRPSPNLVEPPPSLPPRQRRRR